MGAAVMAAVSGVVRSRSMAARGNSVFSVVPRASLARINLASDGGFNVQVHRRGRRACHAGGCSERQNAQGFVVRGPNGQQIAYVYFEDQPAAEIGAMPRLE
jgi:hypothetical protein